MIYSYENEIDGVKAPAITQARANNCSANEVYDFIKEALSDPNIEIISILINAK